MKSLSFFSIFLLLLSATAKAGVHKSDQELFPNWMSTPVERKCKPRFENEDTLVHLNFVSHQFNNPVDVRYNRFLFPDLKTCEDTLNPSVKLDVDGTGLTCGFFANHNGVYKYRWGIISTRGIGAGETANRFESKAECENILRNPVIANKRVWFCTKFNASFAIATINASYFPVGVNIYSTLPKYKNKSDCEIEMIKLKNKCEQNPNFFKCK